MKKKNIGADFLQLLASNYLSDIAESHIEGWKDRYARKSKKAIAFDLDMNHDPSIEVEKTEDELNRKLTDDEYNYLVTAFNKQVVKQYFTS